MSHPNRISTTFRTFALTQFGVASAFLLSWYLLPDVQQRQVAAELLNRPVPVDVIVSGTIPTRIQSLYDDETVVSEEELAAVLRKILPRFSQKNLRPNYVEHALRVWGNQIEFQNPDLISGPQMADYLLDTGKYIASWGDSGQPILEPMDDGVSIRWGADMTASVHHDHLLACLTEAGVTLDTPVYTPRRQLQFRDVLNQALRDFQLDERETEWSVMAFGFWLAPEHINRWHNGQGREISFDLLADRLMRNHKKHGVCLGTHRVYSLMALLRLNQMYDGSVLSDETRQDVENYILDVRDLIIASQEEDGAWPPNWQDGAGAEANRDAREKPHRRVIATGHHLEWLAIAPERFHPDRNIVRHGADWAIRDAIDAPQSQIDQNYTFYSHVGNALALWRNTTPAEFWQQWRSDHPEAEEFAEPAATVESKDEKTVPQQAH
ncbi:MAG: hypothetical protein KDA91_05940 [Planctomycetaceae bacterium]|nr:hypothetical protein [Planctomycetaceae bacterium]